MSEEKYSRTNYKKIASRVNLVLSLLLNVTLFFGLIVCLLQYSITNANAATQQNLNNIAAISEAKSVQAETLLTHYSQNIVDIYNYCNDNPVDDALDDVYNTYGNDKEHREYQFIRYIHEVTTVSNTVYRGYSTARIATGYMPILYQGSARNSMFSMFSVSIMPGTVKFTRTFTNYTTGVKSFSPFCHITLKEADGTANDYILLSPRTGNSLIDNLTVRSQYSGVSTAIFDPEGNYLAAEAGYKADNIYDYLYTFNGLTMDQRNELCTSVKTNVADNGFLYYKDSKQRACTFAYTQFTAVSDWYISVCVLDTEFIPQTNLGPYQLAMIFILIALLVYDVVQLLFIIRKQRISVANEIIANNAKTDFLSRMSHDIRTPMNGIMGLTELTLEIKGLPEEAIQNLKSIAAANKYLVSLVNDILDMNVISAGKLTLHEEVADVEEIITNVTQLSHAALVEKSLSFVIHKDLPYDEFVMLDLVRFKQILMNILSNAIKYTETGGRIDLFCKCLKQENDRLYYRFAVKDTGVGMSEEYVKNIFEPFSREFNSMTSKQAGTGLGMAIVKTLVDLMGGTIKITSEKGVGTQVDIDIDFLIADVISREKADQELDLSILENKMILLVDDHQINVTIAKKMLEMHNMKVDVALNGEIALHKFTDSAEYFYDAILMDVQMPVMDGLEATKAIRLLPRVDAQTVPIIAMTANAFAEDIAKTKHVGMNAHLAKPIEKAMLLAELSKQIFRRLKNK